MESKRGLVIVHDDFGYLRLEVDGDVLRYINGKKESVIPIASIRSFTIKDARGPLRPGAITIDIGAMCSGFVRAGGFAFGFGNEITMPFDKPYSGIAYKMQEYVASFNRAQTRPIVSAADEIRKLKELCDEGIITHDEFQAKKKELLGF